MKNFVPLIKWFGHVTELNLADRYLVCEMNEKPLKKKYNKNYQTDMIIEIMTLKFEQLSKQTVKYITDPQHSVGLGSCLTVYIGWSLNPYKKRIHKMVVEFTPKYGKSGKRNWISMKEIERKYKMFFTS